MRHALALVVSFFLAGCASTPAFDPLTQDPPRDATHPAAMHGVTILSHGARLNGRFYLASGAGPHPTMLIARGFPDGLGSLDIAMALRRAGFNMLSFDYRGCWGSEGTFTLMNSFEDVQAALAFLRSPDEAARLHIDTGRIALLGFSWGGPVVLKAASEDKQVQAVAVIDGTDMRSDARDIRAHLDETMQWLDSERAVKTTSARAVVDEILAREADWNPVSLMPGLAGKRTLLVIAEHGTGEGPAESPTLAELLGTHTRLTHLRMDTDHGFSDHRVAITRAVLTWARGLP